MVQARDIIRVEYQGIEISFSEKGWFDATAAAARYGKRPGDWLRLPDTEKYLDALCRRFEVRKSHFVKTRKGGNTSEQGTWFHPKLAVPLARWLDVDFSVWCDELIYSILHGDHPHFDWKRIRHEASSSFKVMNEALRIIREEQGKTSKSHHYSNEARLVNWALSGKFSKLDRDYLTEPQLSILAKLEVKNSVLISRNVSYQDRKILLEQYAIDLRPEPEMLELQCETIQ